EGIEELKEMIFEKLDLIRIYCKEVGKKADLEVPLIMKRGCTVKDMCEKLHRDFVRKFKFAKVWGPSAKFPGQKFKLKHELKDEDIVELHIN
ncbi:TGS domain-containing protein, partial [Candidatus Woesearchaeota archaeon]